MAHVSSGRRDRGPWEDHLAYLGGLRRVLHGNPAAAPSLVVGDWNQMIPRIRAPDDVFAALTGAFPPDMEVATQGELSPLGRRAVDHAAHTPGLVPVSVRALSNIGEDGMPLTDHFGVHITFAPRTE
jgi:endonuclease/exonuclease/phosphatase family metal-dependent hydrolase